MWDYSKKVKDHFLHPRNAGEIKNPDGVGEVGSMACGDALKLFFKLDKNGRIKEVKFQTFGCASAIASSSAMTEMIKGKTLEEAARITNKDIADYLGGLPEAKMHCSVMGREALMAAIDNYNGIKPAAKKLLDGKVICECFGVTEKEIIDAIKANNLTTIEQVTNYTKAGGGCGKCHDEIASLIKRVQMERGEDKKEFDTLTSVQKIHRIDEVIANSIRPFLKQDGGDIELVDLDGHNVYVTLKGACAHCKGASQTMKIVVEERLRKEVSNKLTVKEVHK